MGIKSKTVVTVNIGNDDTGIYKKKLKRQPNCSFQVDQAWEESHRASRSSGLDDRNKMKGCPENMEHM